MRRLLLLPALALLLLGTPVLALQDPAPPSVSVEDVPITPAAQPVEAGWQSEVTPTEASTVGITWNGDPAASFTVEAQQPDGSWSAAPPLEPADLAPDTESKDAAPVVAAQEAIENASEPVWIGAESTAVRVTVAEGTTVSDVSVAAVVETDGTVPDGAAGAVSDVIGPLDGTDKWLFGAALAGTVALLIALAFGWAPFRSRRRRASTMLLAVACTAVLLAACTPIAPPPPPPAGPAANGPYPGIPGPMYGRARWGAADFNCSGGPDYASSLKYAVVHHTAGNPSYSPGEAGSVVRGIQAYHMGTLGYCDIAYNFVVDQYGQIFEGRAGGINRPVIGGHAGGFNSESVGIVMIGDFTGRQPSGSQFNSLVNLLRWRLSIAKIDPATPFSTRVLNSPCNCQNWPPGTIVYFGNRIISHRDVDQTACPGNSFYPRMDELRANVQPGVSFPH